MKPFWKAMPSRARIKRDENSMRIERLERTQGYFTIRHKLREEDMAVDIPLASVNFSPSAKLIGPEFESYTESYIKFSATRMAGHVFFHDSIKDN